MKIQELLDVGLLADHVSAGLVSARFHETEPLVIYNYTPECQYSRAWDDVTTKTRGLIVNADTDEIVARPFEKFFNWDEGRGVIPTGPALRMEKLDGSLGILYMDRIATRGSFHSEQAEWATSFYMEHLERTINETPGPVFEPVDGKTYLFEIIYKGNRIVVDYGDYEGLILIDVIDNETGHSDLAEFDECAWPDKASRVHVPAFDSGQVVDVPPGDEGFVYLWPVKNYRVKLKTADYVILHRLVSNLSPKTIWEHLVNGGTKEELKRDLPEEFWPFIDETADAIEADAVNLMREVYTTYLSIVDRPEWDEEAASNRKIFAMEALKHPHVKAYLFKVYDGKAIWTDCLRAVKPSASSDAE